MNPNILNMPRNWEFDLEKELLFEQKNNGKKRAYICSPCSDDSAKQVHCNVRAARFYMYIVKKELDFTARAPHAYMPILLNDANPDEREKALRLGLDILETSDVVLVCGTRMSNGMRGEIERAAELDIPVIVFDYELFITTDKVLAESTAPNKRILFDSNHPNLALCANELFNVAEEERYAYFF